MKLTEIQRCIIVINIMGVILDEYAEDETTAPIRNLKTKCKLFATKQSGVEEKMIRNSITKQRSFGPTIVDAKRHNQYLEMNRIGDSIWNESIDHFAKQKLKIDAVSLVEAIYLFHEKIINKHTRIKREDLDAYRYENNSVSSQTSLDGTAVGGHLMGLLAREMGESVNGKLRAIKNKINDGVAA